MRLVLAVSVLLAVSATGVSDAQSHPGRLNKEGCHQVHTEFRYKDGRVAKVGETHCHRLLGEMKLDGKEVLQDGPHDHRDDAERCFGEGPRTGDCRMYEGVGY